MPTTSKAVPPHEWDPFHRAEIDSKRLALGERFGLTVPQKAILAARLDDDDEAVEEVA